MELIAMARCGWRISAIVPLLALAAVASGAELIGVVTELHAKGGRIEVKSAGSDNWEIPRPLRSIRAGDHVRVSGTARAVILLTGGSRAIVITATNSPFVIVAPSQPTFLERTKSAVREGVEAVTGERKRIHIRAAIISSLQGYERERTYQPLSAKAAARRASLESIPPQILSPRDTRVLPEMLTFEWAGSPRLKYHVRLLNPSGTVVWEQADVERRRLAYPSTAPALAPGVRYTWELTTKEHGIQRASFDVASIVDATRVNEELAALTPASGESYPPATLALLRAALLFQQNLYADARRELIGAVAASPEEPTLHVLLGHVYDRTGLKQLAEHEFDHAEALAAPGLR